MQAAIGDDHPGQAVFVQVPGRELDGLARAHQQRGAILEFAEDLLREPHCGIGDRDRVIADGGVVAHLFRDPERMLEQAIQLVADAARRQRLFIGGL